MSRHLRLLKEAGLVAEEAQGTSRIYHLREEGLHAVQAYLEQVWGDAAHRGWERLGPQAARPWRDRNQANWQTLLPHFIEAITQGEG